MQRLLIVCLLALSVGAFVSEANEANAQSVDVRQACTPDAMRLCGNVIPDVPKTTACMRANRRLLSVECRTAMAGGRHERYEHGHRYYGRHVRHERHHH
jgi:hypothetical protein